jgi:hypothetical protein
MRYKVSGSNHVTLIRYLSIGPPVGENWYLLYAYQSNQKCVISIISHWDKNSICKKVIYQFALKKKKVSLSRIRQHMSEMRIAYLVPIDTSMILSISGNCPRLMPFVPTFLCCSSDYPIAPWQYRLYSKWTGKNLKIECYGICSFCVDSSTLSNPNPKLFFSVSIYQVNAKYG